MHSDHPVTRRESLKKLLHISGGLALGGFATWPGSPLSTWAGSKKERFIVGGVGKEEGYAVKALTKKVFDAVGGMKRFVSKGDVVVIKPNISWARRPELAAGTHPDVLRAVIELCQEAGAKKVRIADHTIHPAGRCFAITGAGEVAKITGADLVYPRSSLMKEMKLQGNRLNVWPVFTPLVEADKVINLPVAKHHSLSVLTLGMKNWIGGVGGSRRNLHQDIHNSIVDLARFFRPTVTLIDAVRILIRNGPVGGSLSDVALKNTLILSNDPVAADARAALLFDRDPKKLPFIRLAEKQGLGTTDFSKLDQKQVTL
jgi:uncharacterized protein (DUF362 family)